MPGAPRQGTGVARPPWQARGMPGAHRQGSGLAVLMVLGSCTSLQVGAACAARLFPVIGSAGATFLRLAVAAILVLLAPRPRLHRWTAGQWRSVALFGLSLAGMNGFFYASIA